MARRIFLSFAYEDRNQVNGFKLLRWNEQVDVEFFDSSLLSPVQSSDPNYIARVILERMQNTTVTVVLIGPTTHQSSWVNWEIEQTLKAGKGVLGIRLKDQDSARMPSAMLVERALIGNWNPEHFSNWIEEAARKAGR